MLFFIKIVKFSTSTIGLLRKGKSKYTIFMLGLYLFLQKKTKQKTQHVGPCSLTMVHDDGI